MAQAGPSDFYGGWEPLDRTTFYATPEEAKADWYTIAPRYRTKERLEQMLKQVQKPR